MSKVTRRIVSVLCQIAFVFAAITMTETIASAQMQVKASGGFMDSATSAGLRPMLSAGQIQTLLPDRGPFQFPAPYGTTGVRLTNASDCGGQDCVHSVGYSYWSNINNHVGSDTLLAFLGLERRTGGGGPTLFSFNKKTGETKNLGPMFTPDSPYSWATGEGWYFSATQPYTVYMNDGPNMLRYNVMTHTFSTVYNVESILGAGREIWQMHSSDDDRVHSATVRDTTTYAMLGCIAYDESRPTQSTYIAATGDYDECQIDKSGRYLVIKENIDGLNGEDNRIVDLQGGPDQIFLDQNGAAGHSDVGFGYMIAEDNFNPAPDAVRVWQLGQDLSGSDLGHPAGQGTLVYQLSSWDTGIGHIAHGNATPGSSTAQMACVSNASRENLPRVNEIVCFRLDGSLNTLVVAPNLVDLNASGGGTDDYWKIPMGNLDVTGEYFIWAANMGGNRQDAFLVRIPQDKLGVAPGAPAPTTPVAPAPPTTPTTPTTPVAGDPTPAPTAPAAPTPPKEQVSWMSLVNLTANGTTLEKTAGCGGCPDASATSSQQINGSGALQFSADDASSLRYIGLSSGGVGTAPGDITFALRLQAGIAEVRESGTYKSEIAFGAGDTFSIIVSNGSVSYAKNGGVFYVSSNAATFAVRAQAIFYDTDGTIRDVTIGSGGAPAASSTAPATAVTTTASAASATSASSKLYAVPRPAGSTPVRK